ncbi:MAG: hypothetical protein IKL47_02005 [Clostridia bacterium]|nr:hypothetical protein [Clostridia bacterium]
MDINRVLNSVGKSTFVKYYYCFRDKSRDECIVQIEEDYTDKAKGTRTGHAQRIFREGKHLEALNIIVSSNRVDEDTRLKAREILSHESM